MTWIISPEDFDHGIFFWNLTTNLAGVVGLYDEPPGKDGKEVSSTELESRRQLIWAMLGLDWAGDVIAGVVRQPIDGKDFIQRRLTLEVHVRILRFVWGIGAVDFYKVELPGTVGCELDPTDGWPTNPVLSVYNPDARPLHYPSRP